MIRLRSAGRTELMDYIEALVHKIYLHGLLPSSARKNKEQLLQRYGEDAIIEAFKNGIDRNLERIKEMGVIVVEPRMIIKRKDVSPLEELLGEVKIPQVVKRPKVAQQRRRKRKAAKPAKTIEEYLAIRKRRPLKIHPEPYSRDVFHISAHGELTLLRHKHFKLRLQIARKIARQSGFINDVYTIEEIAGNETLLDRLLKGGGKEFPGEGRLVALVYDKRSVSNGYVITLEDETGMLEAFLPKDMIPQGSSVKNFYMPDGSVMSIGDLIIPDEALFVRLKATSGGRYVIEDVARPGEVIANVARFKGSSFRKDRDFSVIFVSDTHVGSKNSIARELKRLWRRMRNPKEAPEAYREVLAKAELVLVGGDLVDGIGVYPGQENELEIKDPERQYSVFGELFSECPVEVVAIPGNHDPTTTIIPQPVPEYAMVLKEYGIKITQNPARIEYDGFRVAMYHGRSMEDLVLYTPIQLQDVPQLMKRIALSNFYVPIYGGKEGFRPDPNDPLAIAKGVDDIPHVIFMGHIHVAAYASFGPIKLINGGTTQTQPEEKVMNIEPTPGRFVAMDLKTRRTLELSILRDLLHH